MNKQSAIKEYNDYIKINSMFRYAIASISFDDATGAPKKAFQERNEVINYFQMELFKRSTSNEYRRIINNLKYYYEDLSERYQRIVDLASKELKNSVKVPQNVMYAYQLACSNANYYWELAKNKNDYNIYKPYLKDVIEKQIEVGKCMKVYNKSLYETFLDMYEEDITERELDLFFAKLKERIVPLLKKIMDSNVEIRDDFLYRKMTKNKQMKMGTFLVKKLGYDLSTGMIRETEHPFTNDISSNDVRITTHIYIDNFASNLFSMAHEGGHGIYGQNIDKRFDNSILKDGASMAFHESQSRFYENIVSRSEAFSKYLFPHIKKIACGTLDDVTWEEYYKAINKVEPSLIRTEADELTYCLHIMIRYEIEKLLINNQVDYDTLNTLWNQKYKEYLGVDVTDDAHGILQDIHWTSGVGYFFSYALGNAYSAQIYNAMKKELDVESLLEQGDTKPILSWLKKNIYKHGMLYKPKQLLKMVTGESLNVDYYCDYLEEKFSKIYNL